MIKNDYGDGDVDALNLFNCYFHCGSLPTRDGGASEDTRLPDRDRDMCSYIILDKFLLSKCNK